MRSRADAVLPGEELVGALGDRELALARDRHALLLVLVDAADHHRRAVGAQERHHPLEALLAVLEVDRVDDRLALAVAERQLDHAASVESIMSGTFTLRVSSP